MKRLQIDIEQENFNIFKSLVALEGLSMKSVINGLIKHFIDNPKLLKTFKTSN
jgi:hypothetical protein